MEFKNIDALMAEYKEAAKDIPEPFKDSYILGRLESAYKVLHGEYILTKKRQRK